MKITYPDVQIDGTAEEICAVLQCLMLNVAAGSLREEMDRVAEAIGAVDEHPKNVYYKRENSRSDFPGFLPENKEDRPQYRPSIEEIFKPVSKSDEDGIPEEPDEYGDTPEGHMMQAIFGDPKHREQEQEKKKHAPKTGKTAPQAVELRAKGGEWVRYESLTEAAAAIGVRRADIRRSLMHGWLVKGYEVRAEGKERKQPKIGYHTCGKPRKVDVKVEKEWYTFDKLTDAAKFIGCGANNLATSIAKGKYKGYEVRYHVDDSGQDNPELDAILKEIEDRNKQPYEISSRL